MTHSNKKILFRNISSLFLVQVANYLFPMISIPIVVRIIGPENFGIINYASAIIAYFTLLINYGFNLTATRKISQHANDQEFINKVFSEVLGAKLLLFFFSFLIFAIASIFIPEMHSHWQVMWFSFIICIAWVITPDWLYQGLQQLHKIAYFNLASKVVFTVIVLLVVREKSDYFWQPFVISLAQVFVAFVSWRYAISKFHLKISLPNFKAIRDVLWHDRMMFFSSVVISLYTTTNTVILGIVSTSTEVGYYTAAQRFMAIGQSLISIPLAQSLFPFVGKAFGHSREEGLATVKRIAPLIAGFTFLCGCIMWLAGPSITELFYGDKFYPSRQMFKVMAFVPFIISLSNLFGIQVMINLHMDKAFFRITTAGGLLSLCLNGILASRLGGLGTAYTALITECFITIAMLGYLLSRNISIIQPHSFHPSVLHKQAKVLLSGFRK